MIKYGMILGGALAMLSGIGVLVSFIALFFAAPGPWLIRLFVSLSLLAFLHFALPVLANYMPQSESTEAKR